MDRVFLDMDGVIVDFDGYMTENNLTADEVKKQKGAYLKMHCFPGALEGIKKLTELGYDIFLATKPPTGIAHAYSDKAEWVFQNIPDLKRKLIITNDKGLLGDEYDFLVDDRPDKANCKYFSGKLIVVVGKPNWDDIITRITEDDPWITNA